MKICKIKIGDYALLEKTFSKEDTISYSAVSKDANPIHIDDYYAKKSRFNKCIVQGMLVAGLISGAIGTKLPGPGSIYLEQQVKFLAPVFLGDSITAIVTVIEIIETKNIYRLSTVCTNQDGISVIEGTAVVLFNN